MLISNFPNSKSGLIFCESTIMHTKCILEKLRNNLEPKIHAWMNCVRFSTTIIFHSLILCHRKKNLFHKFEFVLMFHLKTKVQINFIKNYAKLFIFHVYCILNVAYLCSNKRVILVRLGKFIEFEQKNQGTHNVCGWAIIYAKKKSWEVIKLSEKISS